MLPSSISTGVLVGVPLSSRASQTLILLLIFEGGWSRKGPIITLPEGAVNWMDRK